MDRRAVGVLKKLIFPGIDLDFSSFWKVFLNFWLKRAIISGISIPNRLRCLQSRFFQLQLVELIKNFITNFDLSDLLTHLLPWVLRVFFRLETLNVRKGFFGSCRAIRNASTRLFNFILVDLLKLLLNGQRCGRFLIML